MIGTWIVPGALAWWVRVGCGPIWVLGTGDGSGWSAGVTTTASAVALRAGRLVVLGLIAGLVSVGERGAPALADGWGVGANSACGVAARDMTISATPIASSPSAKKNNRRNNQPRRSMRSRSF